jgi:hypothetical protein
MNKMLLDAEGRNIHKNRINLDIFVKGSYYFKIQSASLGMYYIFFLIIIMNDDEQKKLL